MADISGRIAVVTGAGNGIGRAIAHALAGHGARVAVVDIGSASAEAVVKEIEEAGGQAMPFVCDVSDRASVKALQSGVESNLGPVSLLIANAGVTMFKPLTEMSDRDVDWLLQVNLFGVINCLKAFLPNMIERREGHVLATASSSALVAPFIGDHAAYVASKAGVVGLMLSMQRYLQQFDIGASVLCPGGVSTQIFDSPRYRPERFGGPLDESLQRPNVGKESDRVKFRPAEEVAQMVLNGIRENKAVIATDAKQREKFEEGMVHLIREAFDDAAQFDKDVSSI